MTLKIENLHDYKQYLEILMKHHPIDTAQQKENRRVIIDLMVSGFNDGVVSTEPDGLIMVVDDE